MINSFKSSKFRSFVGVTVLLLAFQNCLGTGPAEGPTPGDGGSSSSQTSINGPKGDTLDGGGIPESEGNGDPYGGGNGVAPPLEGNGDPYTGKASFGHFKPDEASPECSMMPNAEGYLYKKVKTLVISDDETQYTLTNNCTGEIITRTINETNFLRFSPWHVVVDKEIYDLDPEPQQAQHQYTSVLCTTRYQDHGKLTERDAIFWRGAGEYLRVTNVNEFPDRLTYFNYASGVFEINNDVLTHITINQIHQHVVDMSVEPDSLGLYPDNYTRYREDGTIQARRRYDCFVNRELLDQNYMEWINR